MTDDACVTKPARKPRADGLRNRDRVLEAAKIVFSAGVDGSLEAVARQAGVGIGTLYRHFPTREALFEAVYRREVDQLSALADRLGAEPDPVDALRQWMGANVDFIATKKGMSAALAMVLQKGTALSNYTYDNLVRSAGMVLQRAVDAGSVRGDVGAEDLLRALIGLSYTYDGSGWQANVRHLVDVFIDGLCTQDRPKSAQ
jgi:AcrR family transcriptional regulator